MADTTTQIEVLKISRDLLMDEYVETVNQLEQQWSAESMLNWRAYQKVIPYPTMPAPPSISDIIDTANMLLEFFNNMPTTWYPEPEPTPTPAPAPSPTPVEPTPTPTPMSSPLPELTSPDVPPAQ